MAHTNGDGSKGALCCSSKGLNAMEMITLVLPQGFTLCEDLLF